MKQFIAILCLGIFFLSLTSCAAMRKRKCNKCPKFNQVEPAKTVEDLCKEEDNPIPSL